MRRVTSMSFLWLCVTRLTFGATMGVGRARAVLQFQSQQCVGSVRDGGVRQELAKGMIARTTGAPQMGVERGFASAVCTLRLIARGRCNGRRYEQDGARPACDVGSSISCSDRCRTPDVAERLNTDAMAVLAVIRDEARGTGKCTLPVARI